jgi:hypothetical protein
MTRNPEGSGSGIIWGSILASVWIDFGKPLKSTSGQSVFRPTFEGALDECKLNLYLTYTMAIQNSFLGDKMAGA